MKLFKHEHGHWGHYAPGGDQGAYHQVGEARHQRLRLAYVVQARLKAAETEHATARQCNHEERRVHSRVTASQ